MLDDIGFTIRIGKAHSPIVVFEALCDEARDECQSIIRSVSPKYRFERIGQLTNLALPDELDRHHPRHPQFGEQGVNVWVGTVGRGSSAILLRGLVATRSRRRRRGGLRWRRAMFR